MSIIKLNDIIFQVNDRRILSVDELIVDQGDILGIMGPNGAGKSTLVKIMALLDKPTSGKITIHNEPIDLNRVPLQLRRKFSIALQQSLLLDTTVFQNVAVGLKLRNTNKKTIEEKVNYWLEMFQISHLANKHSGNLSGGEAQRVNLARAMVLDPEVIFLDEPFSALDYPTKIQLLNDMKEIVNKLNMTTVFISHDLTEIQYLTKQMIVIMDGEIAQAGLTKDIIENPNELTKPFLQRFQVLSEA